MYVSFCESPHQYNNLYLCSYLCAFARACIAMLMTVEKYQE